MREIVSMIVVLSAICAASGFSLAYLKQTTQPTIEAQVLTYVQGPAIERVYPAASNKPVEERKAFELEGRKVMVFPYKDGDKLLGVALENKAGGFGGDIGVMVGFNLSNDTLLGIGVTTMSETPGLGTKVAEPKFSKQFVGSGLSVDLKSKGGNIDAVSGATVSSTGAVAAVQAAARDYQALKAEIQKTWQ
ncbi:MAG: FMN-binding protein [Desulfovibrio sp.]|jgi:electron transport complex protein RnfG|nr:FMN-binding protein [Desulfovibrio sp.]